jgi:hypothetical protein
MERYTADLLRDPLRTIFCAFCAILILACNGQSGKSFLPDIPGYESTEKKVFVLHKQLLEISGITYVDEKTLAAINDELGKVYLVDFKDGKPPSMEFGQKKDYEDIVLLNDFYYVLESNGNIHRVPVRDPANTKKIAFPKKKKIEFESLYFEKESGKLVLLSKEQRLIDEAIITYTFDPATDTFSDSTYYVIPLREITKQMKDYSAECKPSAAAVHPVLNKLFVIASVGKVLVVCSLKGEVEKVYSLNPDLFSQPEGITFAPNGDMFISNEGLQGKGTIIRFPYRP